MPLLPSIQSPADLKGLDTKQLEQVSEEIRERMIDVVTKTGGHLGASMGTVELAVALHHVFESPDDVIVWDVGHQAYAHKLLTGRYEAFETLRQEGGMSGFLSRDESIHDAFGAGHASTSISAALGIAVGKHYAHPDDDHRVVAVVGDGALTGGMAFEGLNNAGSLNVPLIVILNDNKMSIAPNVGAMSKYLDRVRTDLRYNRAKDDVQSVLERLPQGDMLVEFGKRWKDSFKEFVYHKMIWEELGFTYLGPISGHDIEALNESFEQAKRLKTPVFIHVLTDKGRGYADADNDRERSHSVSAPSNGTAPPKYQDVFASTLIEIANTDPRVVGITAAMPTGTSLNKFAKVHPDKFFDVGIAEQHAVTFAAGLAAEGIRPVCAIYSTFLQRAYDQIIHDVSVQRLPVVFAIDRAGFAGDDGRTHHGVYDFSYLCCIPGMTVMAPKDENELRHMINTAIAYEAGPVAVRYPRGSGQGVSMDEPLHLLEIGKSETLRSGGDVTLLAIGSMVQRAELAATMLAERGIAATVINARFAKPLDDEAILAAARSTGALVTIEENVIAGGFGSSVLELLVANEVEIPVKVLGVPDRVFDHASQNRLREMAGLTPRDIAAAAERVVERKTSVMSIETPIRVPVS